MRQNGSAKGLQNDGIVYVLVESFFCTSTNQASHFLLVRFDGYCQLKMQTSYR
jgi:hypothetical protein